jgi:hypothetical protein
MPEINNPALVAELTALYREYETALCTNDIATMDRLFWDSPEVIRLGATENLYGIEEIRDFRQGRPAVNLEREIIKLKVVTIGEDTASVILEFKRNINGTPRYGRQSQNWYKFPQGWKIVFAHVSFLPVP